MPKNSKRNIEFFESSSMKGLYDEMNRWQEQHEVRFLSVEIHKEGENFSCICLTNPSEVTIVGPNGCAVKVTRSGQLCVYEGLLNTD